MCDAVASLLTVRAACQGEFFRRKILDITAEMSFFEIRVSDFEPRRIKSEEPPFEIAVRNLTPGRPRFQKKTKTKQKTLSTITI